MSDLKKYVIIVAAGSGTRFGSALPKQFLLLDGKPVLQWSVEAFHAAVPDAEIIIVLHSDFIEYWEDICSKNGFTIPVKIVRGGATRFESVKNGLSAIESTSGLVAIHDGARPLVTKAMIEESFVSAEKNGATIPVVPVSDSLRHIVEGESESVTRSEYVAVQTPQAFTLPMLKKGYECRYTPAFTDDASVVEASGAKVSLYKGDVRNIKITNPQDIKIAELLIES